jgi:hypothetical protein
MDLTEEQEIIFDMFRKICMDYPRVLEKYSDYVVDTLGDKNIIEQTICQFNNKMKKQMQNLLVHKKRKYINIENEMGQIQGHKFYELNVMEHLDNALKKMM